MLFENFTLDDKRKSRDHIREQERRSVGIRTRRHLEALKKHQAGEDGVWHVELNRSQTVHTRVILRWRDYVQTDTQESLWSVQVRKGGSKHNRQWRRNSAFYFGGELASGVKRGDALRLWIQHLSLEFEEQNRQLISAAVQVEVSYFEIWNDDSERHEYLSLWRYIASRFLKESRATRW